jgi:hypothetical protein
MMRLSIVALHTFLYLFLYLVSLPIRRSDELGSFADVEGVTWTECLDRDTSEVFYWTSSNSNGGGDGDRYRWTKPEVPQVTEKIEVINTSPNIIYLNLIQ